MRQRRKQIERHGKHFVFAVAAAVRTEKGREFDYRLGVMVETPRAALRADEIAQQVAFLSFGLALFGVRLFGWPFGFQALIGTLGMVGLAIRSCSA